MSCLLPYEFPPVPFIPMYRKLEVYNNSIPFIGISQMIIFLSNPQTFFHSANFSNPKTTKNNSLFALFVNVFLFEM